MKFDQVDDIKKINSEDLAATYDEMRTTAKEIEEAQSVILDELADRLKALKIDGTKFGKWLVTMPKPRISVTDVSLAVAKELGATKEVVDAARVEALYRNGVKIKGVKFGNPRPLIVDSEKPRNKTK